MREVARELLVGLRLAQRPLLAVLPRLLLDFDQLDHHLVAAVHLVDDHVHRGGARLWTKAGRDAAKASNRLVE